MYHAYGKYPTYILNRKKERKEVIFEKKIIFKKSFFLIELHPWTTKKRKRKKKGNPYISLSLNGHSENENIRSIGNYVLFKYILYLFYFQFVTSF